MSLTKGNFVKTQFIIGGLHAAASMTVTVSGLDDSYFDFTFEAALRQACTNFPGVTYSAGVLNIAAGTPECVVGVVRQIVTDVPNGATFSVRLTPITGTAERSFSVLTSKTPVRLSRVRGAAMSGLEFATELSLLSQDFVWLKAKGFTHVRIPYLWNRVQPTLGADLTTSVASFSNLVDAVNWAKAAGLKVILDMHNYGKRPVGATGTSYFFGSSSIPSHYLIDFYYKLATYFGDDPDIFYELQNEPDRLLTSDYMLKVSEGCVGAIRAAGVRTTIIVNTTGPTAGMYKRYGNKQAIERLGRVKDPLDNVTYCVHLYLDAGAGGSAATCTVNAASNMNDVIQYAKDNGLSLICTEFAFGDPSIGANAQCGIEGPALLSMMNKSPFIGWLAWGCGSRWIPSYIFRMIPVAGNDPANADTGYVTTLMSYI